MQQSSIEPSEIQIEDTRSQEGRPSSSRAVDNMIMESKRLLANGEWESAIAMAERGMRIDRRVPELYLILAEGYKGLNDMTRAQQFAQQGLRYVGEENNQEVVESLRHLEGLKTQ